MEARPLRLQCYGQRLLQQSNLTRRELVERRAHLVLVSMHEAPSVYADEVQRLDLVCNGRVRATGVEHIGRGNRPGRRLDQDWLAFLVEHRSDLHAALRDVLGLLDCRGQVQHNSRRVVLGSSECCRFNLVSVALLFSYKFSYSC